MCAGSESPPGHVLPGYSLPVLAAFAGVLVALCVALVALGYWAYHDAAARGSPSPLWWGTAAALPYGVLWYLWSRRGLGERERPPGRRERAALTWVWAVLLAFAFGAVLAPPDPVSQLVYFGPSLVAALPVAYAVVFLDAVDRLRARAPGV